MGMATPTPKKPPQTIKVLAQTVEDLAKREKSLLNQCEALTEELTDCQRDRDAVTDALALQRTINTALKERLEGYREAFRDTIRLLNAHDE